MELSPRETGSHKLRAWQPVRVLSAPPRTLLPAGLLHALPNCASVQRFSAAVSEVLRLWLRAGARFPRLSTARLRLLETVSRRRKQRPVRERRRPVRKHSAACARTCSRPVASIGDWSRANNASSALDVTHCAFNSAHGGRVRQVETVRMPAPRWTFDWWSSVSEPEHVLLP